MHFFRYAVPPFRFRLPNTQPPLYNGAMNGNTSISAQYRESELKQDNSSHFHNGHEMIFVLDGSAEFMIENKKYVLTKNTLLIISNFERHYRLKETPQYKRYVLLFNDSDVSVPDSNLLSLFYQRNKDFRHAVEFTDEDAERIKHVFSECVSEYVKNDRFSFTLLTAKLSELLVLIYRTCPENFTSISENSYRKIIYDAQNFVHRNFREPITLASVAKHFFCNSYYFSSKFKEYTGVPFKKYLINLRLADAKRQLIHTDKSVAQIAKDCGFNDVSNFIRCFQSTESIAPLQFRKKNAPDSVS